jgi:hypothetical protein
MVDDHLAIREALRRKAMRYGQLMKPCVLALNSHRLTTHEHEVKLAMYGVAWEHPEYFGSGKIPMNFPDECDGLWIRRDGIHARQVSAVLVGAPPIQPWSIARHELTVWHNPWAAHPMKTVFPHRSIALDPVSMTLTTTPAIESPSSIFGIADDWPGGDAFPEA